MESQLSLLKAKAEGLVIKPTEPIRRDSPKIGRNQPCYCGSDKKYKKCCLLLEIEIANFEKETKQQDLMQKIVDIGFDSLTSDEQREALKYLEKNHG